MAPSKQLYILSCLLTLTSCLYSDQQVVSIPTSTEPHEAKLADANFPSAPIHIDYQMDSNFQVGDLINIVLNITPMKDAQYIFIEYHMSGTLDSGDQHSRFEFSFTEKGSTIQQPIIVIPQADGIHNVNVTATIVSNVGHSDSKTLRIPIVVGEVDQEKNLPKGSILMEDSQGNPIIVLPAHENISTE